MQISCKAFEIQMQNINGYHKGNTEMKTAREAEPAGNIESIE